VIYFCCSLFGGTWDDLWSGIESGIETFVCCDVAKENVIEMMNGNDVVLKWNGRETLIWLGVLRLIQR